MQKVNNPEV